MFSLLGLNVNILVNLLDKKTVLRKVVCSRDWKVLLKYLPKNVNYEFPNHCLLLFDEGALPIMAFLGHYPLSPLDHVPLYSVIKCACCSMMLWVSHLTSSNRDDKGHEAEEGQSEIPPMDLRALLHFQQLFSRIIYGFNANLQKSLEKIFLLEQGADSISTIEQFYMYTAVWRRSECKLFFIKQKDIILNKNCLTLNNILRLMQFAVLSYELTQHLFNY